MNNNRTGVSSRVFIAALLAWLLLIAAVLPSSAQTNERPTGWTDESHGNRVPANYEVVLPDDRINEIYISFSPESWAAEEADMMDIYGERGTGPARSGPGGRAGGFGRRLPDPAQIVSEIAEALDKNEAVVAEAVRFFPDMDAVAEALDVENDDLFQALGFPAGFTPPTGRGRPGAPGEQPNLQLASRNPVWVPVTVQFGDETWWEVGFRYKGNSTLQTGWRSGAIALPFKLDFDEFEDENPELDNQRFYGFKQLSFGVSDFDPSLQREKVTADIFRDAGVPAAETAYYAVYVDSGAGDGFQLWGIYTAVELPDDTLIETQFADDDGNMYKPAGNGATFAAGGFNERSFDKETNGDSNYNDVLAVFAALHADTRISDPEAWRADLEAVFDVSGFLRWLAANTLLQNWDTYGVMSHNYYLYADDTTGQLVWIPWDNNMALSQFFGRGNENSAQTPQALDDQNRPAIPIPGGRSVLDLSMSGVDPESWPLIGFLIENDIYLQFYLDEVARISKDVFTPGRMVTVYEENFQLLAEFFQDIGGPEDIKALRAATDELIEHVYERAAAAEKFLRENGAL